MRSANADKALLAARESMDKGNLPLAQTDLQKVVARYESTPAGLQAAMLLAQISYDAGKAQDGVAALQKVLGSAGSVGMEAAVRALIADGYMQLKKPAEAAKSYEDAATASHYDNERAFLRAKAARAYGDAGNTAKAKDMWTTLRDDPKSAAVQAEARVR